LQADFLSDIELYFSPLVKGNTLIIEGNEAHHIQNVMRHLIGDEIFITDGDGSIYKTKIHSINKNSVHCKIYSTDYYINKYSNLFFCIPRLKHAERFEFALEKCVELGITNFIAFDSKRTVAKGAKVERWEKILLSAMKQSLRAYLPKIIYVKSLTELVKLNGTKIVFDQKANQTFQQFISACHQSLISNNFFFIFGPEGGFEKTEISNESLVVRLADKRLRSETAIIAAAVELTSKLFQ
jgi:16S rRNA (uracil1498-N3)-methyltransferase